MTFQSSISLSRLDRPPPPPAPPRPLRPATVGDPLPKTGEGPPVERLIKVLALDPGETTGWAYARKGLHDFEISYGQQRFGHRGLWDFLNSSRPLNALICESFEFRQGKQKTGVNLYPCELIGIVHLFCSDFKPKLYLQPAYIQDKKSYFSDQRLKEMGLYRPGENFEHGRSAVKHLLQWFYFESGYQYMNDVEPILI